MKNAFFFFKKTKETLVREHRRRDVLSSCTCCRRRVCCLTTEMNSKTATSQSCYSVSLSVFSSVQIIFSHIFYCCLLTLFSLWTLIQWHFCHNHVWNWCSVSLKCLKHHHRMVKLKHLDYYCCFLTWKLSESLHHISFCVGSQCSSTTRFNNFCFFFFLILHLKFACLHARTHSMLIVFNVKQSIQCYTIHKLFEIGNEWIKNGTYFMSFWCPLVVLQLQVDIQYLFFFFVFFSHSSLNEWFWWRRQHFSFYLSGNNTQVSCTVTATLPNSSCPSWSSRQVFTVKNWWTEHEPNDGSTKSAKMRKCWALFMGKYKTQ